MTTLTPDAFVATWRGDARKERSVAHRIDLHRLVNLSSKVILGESEAHNTRRSYG
ncbi:hypothetical protein EKD04_017415 [Chloroflexales bacterium ZM16-3]|nr:hypothetical protein [Chloroflexales bacterium ZM16-3]